MKLHLPLPLRFALLAVCAVAVSHAVQSAGPTPCEFSATLGNVMQSQTLNSDLSYDDGTLEGYEVHVRVGTNEHVVRYYFPYGTNDSVTTKSVHSFGVSVYHKDTSTPVQRALSAEVNFTLDGDNKKYSYKVQIEEGKGNVAWIIPYKKGVVKMEEMDVILISGTNYSSNGGTGENWDTPFHECPVNNYSKGYINCLDISISNSNAFTFEKGDHSKVGPNLGALTTDGSLTLTNVNQVSLNDNIGRVMVGSIFTWKNAGTGVGTFSGNKDIMFYDKSGVTIEGVEQVDFANNENTIFKDALVNQVIFKEIGTLVFSGNRAETGVITEGGSSRLENSSLLKMVGDMMFEDVSTLKFTENTATKEYLFTYLIPHTKNCEEIYITNNTAEQGSVLCGVGAASALLNLENTKKGLYINENTARLKVGENYKPVLVTGDIIASGSSEKQAVFEMNDNTGTGAFSALNSGKISAQTFASLTISGNKIQNQTAYGSSSQVLTGELALSGIGTVSLSDNIYETTNKYMSALTSGSIEDFANLRIEGNMFGYDMETGQSVQALEAGALLAGLTVSGRVGESTMVIRDNKIAGKSTNSSSTTNRLDPVEFENLQSFEMKNNSAINSRIFSSVTLNNIGTINVEGNTITDDSSKVNTSAMLSGVRGSNIGNNEIVIKNNTVQSYLDAHGAAIACGGNQGMTITSSHVEISGNKSIGQTSAGGAALWLDDENPNTNSMLFEGCGTIAITDNGAQSDDIENAQGGAIHAKENLEFKDNESVVLRGNYVRDTSGENCHLNAIYFADDEAELRIKASAGQTFTSYDGIYVQDDLCINGDEEDQSTAYTGTVTFSGVHAKEDLAKLKSNYTEAELEASKTVHTDYRAKVYRGTLVLDHSILEVNREYDIFWSTALLSQATPHFESTQDALLVMKGAEIRTKAMLNLSIPTYGLSSIAKADFSESNVIDAFLLNAEGGTWTFRLSDVNKETPVLRIEFTEGGAGLCSLTTTDMTFDIQSATSNFTKGKYILLSFNTENGSWDTYGDVTLTGLAKSSSIGESKGEGDVYFVQQGTERQLIFESAEDIVSRRDNTTLTWRGERGTWRNEAGSGENPTWTADVEDVNFYTGDGVVFKNAANVTIEGTVRPGSVLVENAEGQDVVFTGSGQITDVDIPSKQVVLTKRGEGKLTINTANAYTGGTVLEAGTLVTGNANALGVGGVMLNGGTLDMGGQAVGNTVTVKKAASITNGGAYTGKLVLDGGTLDGAVNLAQDAELKNGTVTGVLSGKGGVVVSGGAVTLSGANTYTGKTTVQSGTLTVSGGVASKEIEVQSGGTYSGTLSGPDLTVTLAGGTLKGNVTLDGGVALNSTVEGSKVDGRLNLAQGGKLGVTEGSGLFVKELVADGGTLSLDGSGDLEVGTFATTETITQVNLGMDVLDMESGTYVLLKYDTLAEGSTADHLQLESRIADERTRKQFNLELKSNSMDLLVSGESASLEWNQGSKGTWENSADGGPWDTETNDKTFFNGDSVTFNVAEEPVEVEVVGEVRPGSINVKGNQDVTFQGSGSITGRGALAKEGSGTLRMKTNNVSYSGDISVLGGTLEVGHENALGTGAVLVQNARFDAGNFAVKNHVKLAGTAGLKGANSVKELTFANGSSITADGAYVLGVNQHLLVDGHSKTRSVTPVASSFSGGFVFAGGTLSLNGGLFDLTGATVSFNPENGSSTLDLTDWEGLTYGDYTLLQGHEGQWEAGSEALFNLSLDETLQKYAELKVSEDGSSIELVIKRPSENPSISAALNRNQRAAYKTLAAIAEQGTAVGKLAEMADNVADAQDARSAAALVDRLSGAELATILSAQTEGNMAHIRRLRNSIGTGHLVSPEHRTAAYVTGYNEDTQLEQDAKGLGYKRVEWGGTVGMETGLHRRSVMGLALSSGRAYVTPDGGSRRYHEDNTRGDIYMVAYQSLNIRSTFSMGYGVHRFNVSRMLPDGSISKNGSIRGNSLNMGEEMAYTIKMNEKTSIEPFFAVESSFNRVNSFTEYGAGTASIGAQDSEAWATDLSLGVRTTHAFSAVPSAPAAVFTLQAALVASVGDNWEEMTLSYTGAPDMSYEVRPAKRNRWGFTIGTSIGLPVSENFSVIGGANATLRGDSSEFSGSVGLRFNF